MSVMPRTAYQEGIPRMFKKFDNLDYYFPEFANLGEQAITNDEVFYDRAAAAGINNNTWGYQSRYAEYKWQPDTVHGDFKHPCHTGIWDVYSVPYLLFQIHL